MVPPQTIFLKRKFTHIYIWFLILHSAFHIIVSVLIVIHQAHAAEKDVKWGYNYIIWKQIKEKIKKEYF